ncbi:LysR substrate-binding domain-containing protein [Streptomyces sp. NPDC086989]|uniref:LysR substrate-binding domain-containing protein n=1 Tax=Streptomyces sp. NPDC086989 TaxID=3365764 RepID=UPI0038130A67
MVLTPLVTEPVFALLPATHPLAGEEAVSLTELADHDWAMPRPDGDRTREYWSSVSALAGRRPSATARGRGTPADRTGPGGPGRQPLPGHLRGSPRRHRPPPRGRCARRGPGPLGAGSAEGRRLPAAHIHHRTADRRQRCGRGGGDRLPGRLVRRCTGRGGSLFRLVLHEAGVPAGQALAVVLRAGHLVAVAAGDQLLVGGEGNAALAAEAGGRFLVERLDHAVGREPVPGVDLRLGEGTGLCGAALGEADLGVPVPDAGQLPALGTDVPRAASRRGGIPLGCEQHGGVLAVGGGHPGGQVGEPDRGLRVRLGLTGHELGADLEHRHRVLEVEPGRRGDRGGCVAGGADGAAVRAGARALLPRRNQEAGDGVTELVAPYGLLGGRVARDAVAVRSLRRNDSAQGGGERGRGEDGGPDCRALGVSRGLHGRSSPQPWIPMREWVHWNELLFT